MNSVALAIKVTADASQAAAGIDGVTTKTSKMGKAGNIAGKALAAGLLIAGAAAVKATQAAAEDEAAQVKLAGALKNATGARAKDIASVEAWITAQGVALGVSDSELRPAMEALVTATGNVAKAQQLAGLAMDISARKGVSLEAVSKSLAKAQATGSVGALAKYGVATKDAEGKTRSLEAIQKDLAKMYTGSAAAAAETAAGKQKKLSVAMGELQEEIGAKLLPVMLKLSQVGLQVVAWIERNQTAALAIVGTLASLLAVVKLVSAASAVWGAVTAVASVAIGAHAAVTGADTTALAGNKAALAAHAVVSKAAAAAQWILNAAMAANPVLLIVIAVVALAAALVLAYKKSETFRAIVDAAFGAIAKTVGVVVDFIKNNWQKMLIILTGPIGIAVALIVKHWDKIQAGAAAVVGWIKDKWSATKELISEPIEKAKLKADAVWEAIKTGFVNVKAKIEEVAGNIKTAAVNGFQAILSPVQAVIDKIQALYDKLVALKNAATGAGGGTKGPNQNPASSRSIGADAGTAARGGQVININVNVPNGFVGDDVALARKIRGLLATDLRRLSPA